MLSKEVQPRATEISEREFWQILFEKKEAIVQMASGLDPSEPNYEHMVELLQGEIDSLGVTRDLITQGQETHCYKFYLMGEKISYKKTRKSEMGFRKDK